MNEASFKNNHTFFSKEEKIKSEEVYSNKLKQKIIQITKSDKERLNLTNQKVLFVL
jgi:hypothetical protein